MTNQIAAELERTKSEEVRLTALIGGLEAEITELQAQIDTQNERIRVSDVLVLCRQPTGFNLRQGQVV